MSLRLRLHTAGYSKSMSFKGKLGPWTQIIACHSPVPSVLDLFLVDMSMNIGTRRFDVCLSSGNASSKALSSRTLQSPTQNGLASIFSDDKTGYVYSPSALLEPTYLPSKQCRSIATDASSKSSAHTPPKIISYRSESWAAGSLRLPQPAPPHLVVLFLRKS